MRQEHLEGLRRDRTLPIKHIATRMLQSRDVDKHPDIASATGVARQQSVSRSRSRAWRALPIAPPYNSLLHQKSDRPPSPWHTAPRARGCLHRSIVLSPRVRRGACVIPAHTRPSARVEPDFPPRSARVTPPSSRPRPHRPLSRPSRSSSRAPHATPSPPTLPISDSPHTDDTRRRRRTSPGGARPLP